MGVGNGLERCWAPARLRHPHHRPLPPACTGSHPPWRSFAPPLSLTPTTKVTNSKGKVIKEVPQVYPPNAEFTRRPAWCSQTKVGWGWGSL